ncbi:MAG TPA: hypothetical protein VHZ04_03325, partial [Candidatus Paceibacterota bacterium]|nr:hypothetical protein [Candidatus Paceibacterota bacterium]
MTKQKLFFFAATAAAVLFLAATHTAHGANTYAQYWDNATSGAGMYGVSSTYAVPQMSGASYIQVELNITNDEQRGTSYYCPTAPNTGVLIIVWNSNGNFDYVHCITSAEAAGKLGHKAVYTFNDANFGYGNGISVGFSSQGGFDADVYGTNEGGNFYPYLVLADSGGIGSPSIMSGLGQYSAGTPTLIPENGFADANSVRFESTVSSFFASDTLAMQVEVEPFTIPFTGKPTATSAIVPSGAVASTTVSGLAAGTYHWQARTVDAVNGSSSVWTEYRAVGNIDFNIQTVREPVVIVPGIMGSILDRASDGTEVWPNASKMALSGTDSYLNDLKLTATGGATTALAVGGIVKSELGVPFYEPLIEALTNDGYAESSTLFIAPYDWRLGVASSVAAIAPVLAQAA